MLSFVVKVFGAVPLYFNEYRGRVSKDLCGPDINLEKVFEALPKVEFTPFQEENYDGDFQALVAAHIERIKSDESKRLATFDDLRRYKGGAVLTEGGLVKLWKEDAPKEEQTLDVLNGSILDQHQDQVGWVVIDGRKIIIEIPNIFKDDLELFQDYDGENWVVYRLSDSWLRKLGNGAIFSRDGRKRRVESTQVHQGQYLHVFSSRVSSTFLNMFIRRKTETIGIPWVWGSANNLPEGTVGLSVPVAVAYIKEILQSTKTGRKILFGKSEAQIASLVNGIQIGIQRHPSTPAVSGMTVTLQAVSLRDNAAMVLASHSTAKMLEGDFDGDEAFLSNNLKVNTVGDALKVIKSNLNKPAKVVSPYKELEFKPIENGLSASLALGHFYDQDTVFLTALAVEAKEQVGQFKAGFYWVLQGILISCVTEEETIDIVRHLAENKDKFFADDPNLDVVKAKYADFRQAKKSGEGYYQALTALKLAIWMACYYKGEESLFDSVKIKPVLKNDKVIIENGASFNVVGFINNALFEGTADLQQFEDATGMPAYPLEVVMSKCWIPNKKGELSYSPHRKLEAVNPLYAKLIVRKNIWSLKKGSQAQQDQLCLNIAETDPTLWIEYGLCAEPVPTESMYAENVVQIQPIELEEYPALESSVTGLSDIPPITLEEVISYHHDSTYTKTLASMEEFTYTVEDGVGSLFYGTRLVDNFKLSVNKVAFDGFPTGGVIIESTSGVKYFYGRRVLWFADQIWQVSFKTYLVLVIAQTLQFRENRSEEEVSRLARKVIYSMPKVFNDTTLAALGSCVYLDSTFSPDINEGRRQLFREMEARGFDLDCTNHSQRGEFAGQPGKDNFSILKSVIPFGPVAGHSGRFSKLASTLISGKGREFNNPLLAWTGLVNPNQYNNLATQVNVFLVNSDFFGDPSEPCDEKGKTPSGDKALSVERYTWEEVPYSEYLAWYQDESTTEELLDMADARKTFVPDSLSGGWIISYKIPKKVDPTSPDGCKVAIHFCPGVAQPINQLVGFPSKLTEEEVANWDGKSGIFCDLLESFHAVNKKMATSIKIEMAWSRLSEKSRVALTKKGIHPAMVDQNALISFERSLAAFKATKGQPFSFKGKDGLSAIQAELRKNGVDENLMVHVYEVVDGRLRYAGVAMAGQVTVMRPPYEQGFGSYGKIDPSGVTMDPFVRTLIGDDLELDVMDHWRAAVLKDTANQLRKLKH